MCWDEINRNISQKITEKICTLFAHGGVCIIIESIVEKLPAIMDKLKETFEKKKEEKKSEEAAQNAENAENSEVAQDKDAKPEKSFKIKAAKAE